MFSSSFKIPTDPHASIVKIMDLDTEKKPRVAKKVVKKDDVVAPKVEEVKPQVVEEVKVDVEKKRKSRFEKGSEEAKKWGEMMRQKKAEKKKVVE